MRALSLATLAVVPLALVACKSTDDGVYDATSSVEVPTAPTVSFDIDGMT